VPREAEGDTHPAKKTLRERDKKFRLLFEENPQPMWVFEGDSLKFLEANAAAAALYGFTGEEFRGMSLADIQGKGETQRFTEWLRQPDRPTVSSWRHCTKDGRLIDIEMAVHQIAYGGRKAQLAILLDITGRRDLENQLRQSQKMEAIGLLAGGVAHDFNNLLTIITGYSQLILNNLGPSDNNRHSAEQILKAGERAAALTRQLLAFSRRQVLQPKVLDLNRLVTSLSTMLRRLIGEDVDLRVELGSDLGRVSADPSQIEQVLMNLVINSRDAMPQGGALTIETANVTLDSAYAGRHIAVKPGPYVLLAVSDNGAGMDAATKARLFEPFFTTKGVGRGTGLGLSTVFGIVKQSGGSLEVYSEPGRGTSFKVYLPRIDQPVALEAEGPKTQAWRGSETILLVEDDDMVRNLVRETLERHGYKVLDSAGPLDARRVVENHRSPIHLLITDVVMPKVSGRELAEQMVRERPSMKVLYMSGYTDNAVVNSGILKKEVAFLQKPFTPGALIDKVREVLENGRTKQAGE
jgi:two-component system cell cycle sensor histidine kinase/response regulator CckA